jgi:PAS domain S-box-containing protein
MCTMFYGASPDQDINDHRRIAEALRQSEAKFRTLTETTSSAIFIYQGEQFRYANQATVTLTGYTREEIYKLSFWDLVHPAFHEMIRKRGLARQHAKTVPVRHEFVIVTKDGDERWLDYTGGTIEYQGEPAILGTALDITERKNIEQALRESEENYRTLVENIPIGVYRSTPGPKGRYLMANPAFLHMFGYDSMEELHQVSVADAYVDSSEREVFSDNLLSQGSVTGIELHLKRKDGTPIWGSVTARVVRDEDSGEVAYFDCSIEDITERKNAQESVARMWEAEREQLLLARTLQDVGALLTSQLSLDDVLENILDLLGRVVHYDSASIQLIDENGVLDLSAGRGFPDMEIAHQTVQELSDIILERNWSQQNIAVLPDTHNSSDWVVSPGSERIRSWIGAALMVKGRFIGILNVDSGTRNAYDQAAGETVLAFANQAAIAIENAQLFEAEEKRVAQLETLRQASLSLTSSLDLQAVLDEILESALDLLPNAQVAHIFLYRPEEDEQILFGAALWDDGRRGKPIAQPRPDGLTLTVARSGRPVIVPDMRAHPIYEGTPEEWRGSIVGLPLKIGSRVVGVMNIAAATTNVFSAEDLGILNLLSDQAAIAIENARLFEQAATERRHLGLLYDIGRELGVSLDTDEILERAVSLTCKALDGLLGEAFIYEPENEHRLCLRAVSGRDPPQDALSLDRQLDLKLGTGLGGWVAEQRQPTMVADVNEDPRWLFIPGLDQDVRSALVAPILQRERLLGVMAVLHQRANAFNQDHLELLQAICHQVGLALSNAERYQQVHDLANMLAAEQNRLESLMEHLPAGVLLLDDDYRLVVANSLGRTFLTSFGWDMEGKSLTDLGPYAVEELIAHHTSPLPVEMTFEGDPPRVFEAEARPLGDERPQWVITVREVTEERENQARVQMQERLATVGQLAAGIAHDFNNIMAAIMVYTDLLGRDIEALPHGRERLVIIQQQVQRASSLIRQILDFSRRSVMEQSTLDVLPFIKELDRLLERLLPENIHLELLYQPGSYLIKADPTRLQQVFMNLAVNARDAMPAGGTLSFEIARLRLAPDEMPPMPEIEPGEWVRLTVRDNGVGIAPEAVAHIFEPFYSTKPSGEGTGLGLAQAYGIIKQHGGHIDVHSRVGEGSAFVIYLPALPVPTPEQALPEEARAFVGEGELILLVEDDRVTRDALRAMLETHDYRVAMAANGIEALEIYAQKGDAISLVVSDVVMPEMGGVALYRALRQRWPQVKMLFITGHPLGEDDQAVLEGGSVDWLQKPFSVPEFSRVVKELIG